MPSQRQHSKLALRAGGDLVRSNVADCGPLGFVRHRFLTHDDLGEGPYVVGVGGGHDVAGDGVTMPNDSPLGRAPLVVGGEGVTLDRGAGVCGRFAGPEFTSGAVEGVDLALHLETVLGLLAGLAVAVGGDADRVGAMNLLDVGLDVGQIVAFVVSR